MDDILKVEARFHTNGSIRPLAFIWRGVRYPILSVGRQWTEGSTRHFMVSSLRRRVFEIEFDPLSATWRLCRTSGDFHRRLRRA